MHRRNLLISLAVLAVLSAVLVVGWRIVNHSRPFPHVSNEKPPNGQSRPMEKDSTPAPDGFHDTTDFETITLQSAAAPAESGNEKPGKKVAIMSPEAARLAAMNAIDAGDSYQTAGGMRPLWRQAGALVVKPAEGLDAAGLGERMQQDDGVLDGYMIDRNFDGGIQLLTAGNEERERQIAEPGRMQQVIEQARQANWLSVVNPVFVDPDSQLKLVVTTDIVLRLAPGVDPEVYFGVNWKNVRPLSGTSDRFIFSLETEIAEEIFAEIDRHVARTEVVWAEPDFLNEPRFNAAPDDPLYGIQWHLANTGQGGGISDADADVLEAWSVTTGSTDVVVAIIDSGTQTNHPDLMDNIYVNSNDPINGVDDDNNGKLDDFNGWDFYQNDNDPNPASLHTNDHHGTAVAGVTAAVGNNLLGVSGASQNSKILPIKMSHGANLWNTTTLANAISYAAGLTSPANWRGADILSLSLTSSSSQMLNDALADAATLGRGGKGCAIFAATGNSADDYQYKGINVGPGSWTFEWRYVKDGSVSNGADTAWLADVFLPNGTTQRFDSPGLPPGWSVGGNVGWQIEDDPSHAYGVGRYQARAGTITHNQSSRIRSPTVTVGVTTPLIYRVWVSSQASDTLALWASNDGGATFPHGPLLVASGQNITRFVNQAVGYPASHPDTIAVGASTDFDYRSAYSQFGPQLDFVAPSNGGRSGITTTDRTGADGYDAESDYTSNFGGTSSATPLAAGIAALMLSVNPNLTGAQVRTILRGTADQVGGLAYPGGRNDFYGYGRINAFAAVNALLSNEVFVDLTYTGPENGSAARPFNTVEEGVAVVQDGGTVRITGGTYPENITIARPITLERNGGAGPVIIGN